MSPEVIKAKLKQLREVLGDLKVNVVASRKKQEEAHYELERQVQLTVDLCVSIARRILIIKNIDLPDNSETVFTLLGKHKVIPKLIAEQLKKTVGLRNLLVYEYGKIDYDLFFDGLHDGYKDFVNFSRLSEKFLNDL